MQQLRTSTTTITLLRFTTRNCTLLPTLLLYHSFENYNKSRIKDFRSRHNETCLYYLHLFKLTLDECKTLTKISTRTTSHNHSPKQAHTLDEVGKPANVSQTFHQREKKKVVCIIGGESEALGFHQETTEESRKQQDWFCIKLYIISYQIT